MKNFKRAWFSSIFVLMLASFAPQAGCGRQSFVVFEADDDDDQYGGSAGTMGGDAGIGGTGGGILPTDEQVLALQLLEEKCPSFPTVRSFEEKFMLPRCGKGVTCHMSNVFKPTLKRLPLFRQLVDVPAKVLCTDDFYIDTVVPEESFILTKTRHDAPQCTGGPIEPMGQGVRMPYLEDPLTSSEQDCLQHYVLTVVNAFSQN